MRSNEILTAVIHGARKEEPSTDVQLAAIHALLNSLEFVRDNFEREVRFLFCYGSRRGMFTQSLRVSGITSCKLFARPRRIPLVLFKSGRSSV